MTESPFNKPYFWWFIITLHSNLGKLDGKSSHLDIFHFCEAINDVFDVQFFRAAFLPHITNSDSM